MGQPYYPLFIIEEGYEEGRELFFVITNSEIMRKP